MEAPGITAPVGSLTVPRIVAVGSWEIAGVTIVNIIIERERNTTRTRAMGILPVCRRKVGHTIRLAKNRCQGTRRWRHFESSAETPLLSRGGVAARQRKSREATLACAAGVVPIKRMIC